MFLIRLLVVALTLLALPYVISGITISSFYIALVTAILLGLLNVTLRPILLLLTLPITVLTLGLFALVINAGILLLLSSFVEGFEIAGFLPALGGALLLAIVNWFSHRIFK